MLCIYKDRGTPTSFTFESSIEFFVFLNKYIVYIICNIFAKCSKEIGVVDFEKKWDEVF